MSGKATLQRQEVRWGSRAGGGGSRDELRTGLRGLIGGMEICKTWFMVLVVNLGRSRELPKSLH